MVGLLSFDKIGNSRGIRDQIIQSVANDPSVAEAFGSGAGARICYLSDGDRTQLFELAEKNRHLALGIIKGVFDEDDASSLQMEMIRHCVALLQKQPSLAYWFGLGAGNRFAQLTNAIKEEILELATSDDLMRTGILDGVGNCWSNLEVGAQQMIIRLLKTAE